MIDKYYVRIISDFIRDSNEITNDSHIIILSIYHLLRRKQ